MTHIFSESTEGSSKTSLMEATAKAVQTALKGHGRDGQLKITVIVEGYTCVDGEYRVSVKVLILDPVLEQEDKYHESLKEMEDRLNANQELSDQMHSAIYAMHAMKHSPGIHSIEHTLDGMSDEPLSNFDFDENTDDITVIAPSSFHKNLEPKVPALQQQQSHALDAPSLDMGGGHSPASVRGDDE